MEPAGDAAKWSVQSVGSWKSAAVAWPVQKEPEGQLRTTARPLDISK